MPAQLKQPPDMHMDEHTPVALQFKALTWVEPEGKCTFRRLRLDPEDSGKPFAVQRRVMLAHESVTDVFEIQLSSLETDGSAWAFGSALREALARELGIEAEELGVSVDWRANAFGRRGASVFLFDKAAGGAGFAVQAQRLLPQIIDEIIDILDCKVEGGVSGCPACVLARDLTTDQAEALDRIAALRAAKDISGEAKPNAEDLAFPNARLVASVTNGLQAAIEAGNVF